MTAKRSPRRASRNATSAVDEGRSIPKVTRSQTPLARLGAVQLTDAEARLAAIIADRYPEAALLSARTIADTAGVSPASVSRFARKLGYADFGELQDALAVEMRARLSTPPGRLEVASSARQRSVAALLDEVILRDADNIESTRQMLDSAQLEEFAALLSKTNGTSVYVTGSKKGGIVAAYFAMQLTQLRRDVKLLTLSDLLPDSVLDMSAKDLLVIFEPRRATAVLVRLLEQARNYGAITAAFTDQHPPAPLADCDLVFRTRVDSISVFDSYAAMFALCDAVLAHLIQRMPKAVRARAERLESLNSGFATWYANRTQQPRPRR